jgi:tetratricopeptide (TPR) repeat protein
MFPLLVLLFLLAAGTVTAHTAAGKQPAPALSPASRSENDMQQYVRGNFLALKGDYWGAIDHFRRIAERQPENGAVRYSLSKAFFNLAVLDSARLYGEHAVRLEPDNLHYIRYLAGLAHEMQDYERAALLYGQAAARDSLHTENLFYQALEYLAARMPEKALSAFQQILVRDPRNETTLSQVLLLEIKLKHYKDAIGTLHQLLGRAEGQDKLQLTLGELYVQTGQTEQAVSTYRSLLSVNPRFVPAWIALFEVHVQSGRQEDFLRELQAFYESNPGDPDTKIDLTRLFLIRSEKEGIYVEPALRMLEEITRRYPGDSRMFVLKGQYDMRRKHQEQAVSSFRKAISIDPRNVTAWEELVMAYLDMKRNREAFAALGKARKTIPQQAFRLRVLEGYALFQTGAARKAAAVLEKTVRTRNAGDTQELLIQANTTLALAYDAMGLPVKSRRAYEKVLEIDPHNSMAMNNLAYLLAERNILLRKALKLASDAVTLEPDNGVYLDTLGWVHFRLGQFEKARELIEKALAAGLDEREVYLHLGKVYEKLGNTVKAGEYFRKAFRAKPGK